MVAHHVERGAGVTVAAIPVRKSEASEFGVIEANEHGRIIAFHEKVADPPEMLDKPGYCLASMGNYIFDTRTLIDIVTPNGDAIDLVDIGGDVIPALTNAGVAHVYDFSTNVVPGDHDHNRGYWRDVGSIDSYYAANMDLISPVPQFNLYNPEWPVFSHHPPLPPAKVSRGAAGEPSWVHESLLCQGSIVSGGHVEQSILGTETFVDVDAHVTESILFPGVHVSAGAHLRHCIVDKNVLVPTGMRIGFDAERDRERFSMSDQGVVVIEKGCNLSAIALQ